MQEMIIFGGLAVLVWLYFKYKKGVGQELIVAALMSAAWVGLSGLYAYRDAHYVFGNLNLFPFIAWTAGLVLLREFYERQKGKHGFRNTVIFYVILLLVLEWVGYNMWGIQLASCYPGLLGMELMHMPWWGKAYYLAAGPVYLKLTDYLKVK